MSNGHILVVDDDVTTRDGYASLLTKAGYTVDLAESGAHALVIAADRPPDVVITDMSMPEMDGLTLLGKLHERNATLPVVVATAFGEIASAVHAMRCGAGDFITKPVDVDVLAMVVARCMQRRGGELKGLTGTSSVMHDVYRVARHVAASRATVLVSGESGTGKGELAKAIHALSPRAGSPFVALHCAALPETLLESELFGHEKGSFTGADRRRIGRFEQASHGTLFLDEIGEISPLMQVKLLKVLQDRTFERVGGNESMTVDVRVIAATNRDLFADVRAGRFREDLYYRLNVVCLEMPALRLRGSDILLLARAFLEKYARDNHTHVEGFTDAAEAKLLAHRWPGNVRELENIIERTVVLIDHPIIDADDLPFEPTSSAAGSVRVPGSTMAEIERNAILTTLESLAGSTSRAAEVLQISVRTIQYRLKEYGFTPRGE